MTLQAILAMMLALAPHAPRARLQAHAEAIAHAAAGDLEVVELVVIDFYETSFRETAHDQRIAPFGVQAMRNCLNVTLDDAAAFAAGVMQSATRQCGRMNDAERFGFYITGRCVVTPESAKRARRLRRIMTHGW